MNGQYQNKYRIQSARLSWWDYSSNAAYFITICTQDHRHFFGKIENGQFYPSPEGEIAQQIWQEIPQQFPYVTLDKFQVMPNHVHGILVINKQSPTEIPSMPPDKTGGCTGRNNPMLQDNVARIVRWYKGRCSFEIRKFRKDFGWQARFWDHIIRDEEAFMRIRHYIVTNPENWWKDRFYR